MECELYAVRVFVQDWERAVQFYEETLGLPVKYKAPEMGWAEFDLGGPSLGIERVNSANSADNPLLGRFVGMSLKVDDIAKRYQELKNKGVEFESEPEKQSWGGILAHFKDTEGNIITLLGSDSRDD